MKPEDVHLREVLFEFRQQGRLVRISAIDPRTNTEVISIGDPSLPRWHLKQLAERKLRYVIAKRMTEKGF